MVQYMVDGGMTALLDRAIARVRALPAQDQDSVASLLLVALDPETTPPIDEATRLAIREGLAQIGRGEFADEAEVEALLADRRA